MRHSDPRITLGIYGHVPGDAQCAAAEKGEVLRPTMTARARRKVLPPNRSNRGRGQRSRNSKRPGRRC
jgi:hypothetical protein